jgi:methyl-accepting chemotaxis protein
MEAPNNASNFKVRTKVTILSIVALFISIVLLSTITLNHVIDDLEEQEFHSLTTIKSIKAKQIIDYINIQKSNIEIYANNTHVTDLTKDMIMWHHKLNTQAGAKFPADNSGVKIDSQKYDKYFSGFIKAYGYNDVLVICSKHGHVMYTQAKESDLGENLSSGHLKDSSLAKLWKKVLSTKSTHIVDMSPYAPLNNKPVIFMGTPIYTDGKLQSILVIQLDEKKINNIMQERTGMGKTGETYLVGQDYLMRSDAFLDKENHSLKSSFANPTTGSVKTLAVKEALGGKDGEDFVVGFNNEVVLSSYKAIDFGDFKWVILAEIDEEEVLEAIQEIITIVVIISSIVFIVIAIGIYVSMSMLIKNTVIKSINEVKISSNCIKQASSDLSLAAVSLADMSANQSASVEQITATVEQTSNNVSQSFDNMQNLKDIGILSQQKAHTGFSHMNNLTESMNNISNSSQEINSLVNTIDEIAFQTNLLALNAAVEAARAGEHGLGFAVVSEEVRSLATRSATESSKIRKVIDESVQYATVGDQVAKETKESFEDILSSIEDTINIINNVTVSASEQKEAIEQMKSAILGVDNVTQKLSVNSEQIAASSEELTEQVNNTNEVVLKLSQSV